MTAEGASPLHSPFLLRGLTLSGVHPGLGEERAEVPPGDAATFFVCNHPYPGVRSPVGLRWRGS